MERAVLQFQCADQRGIVAGISDFIYKKGGNIIEADQHSTDPEGGDFFIRVEFYFDNLACSGKQLEEEFKTIADGFKAQWKIHYKSSLLRMGVLVTKPDHCLAELLYLWKSGELPVQIPCVISSTDEHRAMAALYGVPFHLITGKDSAAQEAEILSLARDKTDFLVLARYMRVLSRGFIDKYSGDIINIHHSFLPSFKGSAPYRQAFERGVKVIGATAHFVNEDLDEGPIITQAVEPVSHKDGVEALVRKGKNLEKQALSQAIQAYIDHRVFRSGNKTVVF